MFWKTENTSVEFIPSIRLCLNLITRALDYGIIVGLICLVHFNWLIILAALLGMIFDPLSDFVFDRYLIKSTKDGSYKLFNSICLAITALVYWFLVFYLCFYGNVSTVIFIMACISTACYLLKTLFAIFSKPLLLKNFKEAKEVILQSANSSDLIKDTEKMEIIEKKMQKIIKKSISLIFLEIMGFTFFVIFYCKMLFVIHVSPVFVACVISASIFGTILTSYNTKLRKQLLSKLIGTH